MAQVRVRFSFPANNDNGFERTFNVPDLPAAADRGMAARQAAKAWFDSVRPPHIRLWKTEYQEVDAGGVVVSPDTL